MEDHRGLQQGSLVVRVRAGAGGRAYWDAQWRYRPSDSESWRLKKRRLGLAWQEPDDHGGWRKRPGRCPEGWLDERGANVAAIAAMAEHAAEVTEEKQARRRAAEHKVTVRELGAEWLAWLREVRGAKPSTLEDYAYLLREPGQQFKRGQKVSAGRIVGAFGDRAAAEVTTAEVSAFLRTLDREGLTPRNVNKHRQVLAALFSYGCRADTHGLAANPVDGTDKRREPPPAALDYYEVEEVEALARACERGDHRGSRTAVDPAEQAARAAENWQDAEAFRLLFYTGLRLGEVLTLRWEDVDLQDRLLLVHRGLSSGEETLPKGRRHRFVPLPAPAAATLARLSARNEFTGPTDYVLANRFRPPPRPIGPEAPLQAWMRSGRPTTSQASRPPARCWQSDRPHPGPRVRSRFPRPLRAVHHGSIRQRQAPTRGVQAPGSCVRRRDRWRARASHRSTDRRALAPTRGEASR